MERKIIKMKSSNTGNNNVVSKLENKPAVKQSSAVAVKGENKPTVKQSSAVAVKSENKPAIKQSSAVAVKSENKLAIKQDSAIVVKGENKLNTNKNTNFKIPEVKVVEGVISNKKIIADSKAHTAAVIKAETKTALKKEIMKIEESKVKHKNHKPVQVKMISKILIKEDIDKAKKVVNTKKHNKVEIAKKTAESIRDEIKKSDNTYIVPKAHEKTENKGKLKVLYVCSECSPFILTGGLGEVAYALPKALCDENIDARVILPLFSDIGEEFKSEMEFLGSTYVPLAWRNQYAGVFTYKKDNVIYYFIDNEFYFKRRGTYGHFDDGERFAFFSKAVLETCRVTNFYPDVMHSNDWHTALVPVFLDVFYRNLDEFKNVRTVFTIHNIEFQGKYGKEIIKDVLGIGNKAQLVMMDNCCNYMKGAIESAKAVTTVSKAYVDEILDPYYSYGLDGILKARKYKLSGILNGVDYNVFNPRTDKSLFVNFDSKSVEFKKENKRMLLESLGLEYNDNRPLICMITRLTEQKGIDLLLATADKILSADLQLVILGKGDWKYEKAMSDIQYRYGNKVRAIIDFSNDMSRKIYAASDMFLMPSKFEPCGLSQMISMKYGTVPIVRETGGLKDTVIPFNVTTKEGTGFTFYSYNSYDMLDAVWRAYATYCDKDTWAKLVKNDMEMNFSWAKQAQEYIRLYETL